MRNVPEVTCSDMVFGNTGHLPPMSEIPAVFSEWENEWRMIVSRWFFEGLPRDTVFTPKPGVDLGKAILAIGAILRSWKPKHEHKEAGAAFLLSEWFERIEVPGFIMVAQAEVENG